MNITDEKLKGAIQIALGTHGIYTEKIESDLIHHIKALTINGVVKSLPTKQDMWDERGKQFTKIKESSTELSKHTPHLLGFALGFEKCYEWLTN